MSRAAGTGSGRSGGASRARAVLAIAGVGLRRLLRDRLGLVFTVALPFTVILLVGLAFGGEDGPVTLAITVDGEPGDEARRILNALEAQEALDLVRVGTPAALREQVLQGRADAGLIVPGAPDASRLPVLVGAADAEGAAAARPVVGAVLTRLANPAAQAPPVTTERIGEEVAFAELSRFGYTAPANLVLFTFITSLAASGGLIEARILGIRRRLRASPLAARHVLAGEALGRYLIAVVQAMVVVLGASLVFGVRWGNPLGVACVVGAFALVATAAGLLMGTVLRTPQQASAVGPMLGIAMGMLGGCMWPLEIVGDTMRAVGHATPHAWAVDAMVALGGGGAGGPADVLPQLAALLGFAAVLLPLAVWRLARLD